MAGWKRIGVAAAPLASERDDGSDMPGLEGLRRGLYDLGRRDD